MKSLNFRAIFIWVIGISFIILGYYLARMLFVDGIAEEFMDLYKAHFVALVGLPATAFITTFLILILQVVRRYPIEFEMIGIKFRGTSVEIVFGIFMYLSIVVSIKLLW